MSNATAKVNKGMRGVLDIHRKTTSVTLATALQFYTGAMLGRVAAGGLAKFDDTQAMVFAGLVRGDNGDPKLPIGTQGDGTIDIDYDEAPGFEVAVAGVAITDIGRRVYATFDNAGTLDPSTTTYANLIGVVDGLSFAMNGGSPVSGICMVRPEYNPANSSATLQIAAASGALLVKKSTVIIAKGSAAALTLVDPTTGVHDGLEMTLESVTAFAHTLVAPSGFNASGTTATWGGAKGDNLQLIAYAGKWYVKNKTNITLS